MKTSSKAALLTAIALCALLNSIFLAVNCSLHSIPSYYLIAAQCLGIYVLMELCGEAKRRENKTNKTNEVSQ